MFLRRVVNVRPHSFRAIGVGALPASGPARRHTRSLNSDERKDNLEHLGAYERKDPELEILASEVVLAARPAAGSAVTLAEFRHQPHLLSTDGRVPDGHVLVKTMWLSVDPFMRCRFNEETGVEYTAPYEVGQPIASAGIGFVQVCGEGVEELAPGNIVMDPFDAWPWRSEAVLDASSLQLVPQSMEALIPVTSLLGNVGLSGLTALHGMRDAGQVTATDVVVLSGAAGSVGLLASQIALQAGATVIGICGTPEKAELLTGTVGLHAAVTYTGKSQAELAAELARVIKGLTGSPHATLYFDNVGGTVSEAVIQQLAPKSRVVICGQISMYNTDEEYPPPVSSTTQSLIDDRGIVRERFLVLDYADSFSESLAELCRLTTTGRLQQHETVTRSLEQAPYAFVSMMEGKNFGKALVHCAKPPPSAALFAWLRGVLPPWVRGHLSNVFASAEAFAPELPK